MSGTRKDETVKSVFAPLSGQTVALDQVPDPVFAGKALGDGIAIIPAEGKVYSPVNGEVNSVAGTKHAYGFTSEDGVDVLVHVGLETVGLDGEGFTVHVTEGDKVKVGDLIAEVDLEFIKGKGLNTITPVVICDGMDGMIMDTCDGKVKAGDAVITLFEENAEAAVEAKNENAEAVKAADTGKAADAKEAKTKKKSGINFDFLQKLGKVLMTVIAVMPAAGLMLSIGDRKSVV